MADDCALILGHQRDERADDAAQRIDDAGLVGPPEGSTVELAHGVDVGGPFRSDVHASDG